MSNIKIDDNSLKLVEDLLRGKVNYIDEINDLYNLGKDVGLTDDEISYPYIDKMVVTDGGKFRSESISSMILKAYALGQIRSANTFGNLLLGGTIKEKVVIGFGINNKVEDYVAEKLRGSKFKEYLLEYEEYSDNGNGLGLKTVIKGVWARSKRDASILFASMFERSIPDKKLRNNYYIVGCGKREHINIWNRLCKNHKECVRAYVVE